MLLKGGMRAAGISFQPQPHPVYLNTGKNQPSCLLCMLSLKLGQGHRSWDGICREGEVFLNSGYTGDTKTKRGSERIRVSWHFRSGEDKTTQHKLIPQCCFSCSHIGLDYHCRSKIVMLGNPSGSAAHASTQFLPTGFQNTSLCSTYVICPLIFALGLFPAPINLTTPFIYIYRSICQFDIMWSSSWKTMAFNLHISQLCKIKELSYRIFFIAAGEWLDVDQDSGARNAS